MVGLQRQNVKLHARETEYLFWATGNDNCGIPNHCVVRKITIITFAVKIHVCYLQLSLWMVGGA